MDKYYVADKYSAWDRINDPFDKNGKLYQKVKTKCDRCGGLGIIVSRVENGRPIPIPVDEGICYACGGAKYITKEVRLYTESEYNSMQKAKERAAARRESERQAKMEAEFAHNKTIWLQTNGFSAEGITYIVIGDSYSIKDQLKEAGFHFNGGLRRWMRSTPNGFEDKVIKFQFDDLFEMSAWGEGHLLTEAKAKVDAIEKELFPTKPSEWVGEVGERVPALTVSLVKKYNYDSKYGMSTVYTFETEEGSILTWFTKVDIQKDIGDSFVIAATIKEHTTYKDQKQTIVTRVKVK